MWLHCRFPTRMRMCVISILGICLSVNCSILPHNYAFLLTRYNVMWCAVYWFHQASHIFFKTEPGRENLSGNNNRIDRLFKTLCSVDFLYGIKKFTWNKKTCFWAKNYFSKKIHLKTYESSYNIVYKVLVNFMTIPWDFIESLMKCPWDWIRVAMPFKF